MLIQSLLANPEKFQFWHLLSQSLRGVDAALIDQALDRVEHEIPAQKGRVGFLRASLLLLHRPTLAHLHELRSAIDPLEPDFHELCGVFSLLFGSFLISEVSNHDDANRLFHTLDLDKLFDEQARQSRLPIRPASKNPGGRQRVALLAPSIGLIMHPPTQILFEHVVLLRRMNFEVRIFSPDETRSDQLRENCAVPISNPFSARMKSEWVTAFGHDVRLWVAEPVHAMTRRWSELQQRVEDFAPDLVFVIGAQSALCSMFWSRYPILSLSTVGYAPSGPADGFLRSRPDAGDRAYAFRSSIKPAELIVAPRSRSSLGVPNQALLLVSVGIRLHAEIRGLWAQSMRALLAKHPHLHWLIVASRMPEILSGLEGRVSALPYQSDIAAVLKACDVYVNPDRIGGGLSVATAMAVGLPAVSLARSDGGDKLGSGAAADMAEYFDQLERLIDSATLRQQKGLEQQRRYHDALDISNAGPALSAEIQAAMQRYKARMMSAGAS